MNNLVCVLGAGRRFRPAPFFLLAAALAPAGLALPAPAAAQSYRDVRLRPADIDNREIRSFYQARGWRPLWVRGGELGPEAFQLLELIDTADLDGVDPGKLKPGRLDAALRRAESGSPKELARAEVALSEAFANYVQAIRRPRGAEIRYESEALAPVVPTRKAALDAVAAAPSVTQYFQTMGWMHPLYAPMRGALASPSLDPQQEAALRVNLERIRAIPANPANRYVLVDAALRRAESGSPKELARAEVALSEAFANYVQAIRRPRAAEIRYESEALAPVVPTRKAALEAVAAAPSITQYFQTMGWMHPLYAPMRAALASPSLDPQQEAALRVNLERIRAIPANPANRYVLVDAASARLWMYEGGRVKDSMRVVVGKPDQQTPMLAGFIRYAITNPYWNVPPDLAQNRVAPAVLKEGLGHIRANRYEILSDWTDTAKVLSPSSIDWRAVAAGQRELRIRQLPGKANSMGFAKFMFPNDLGIYLHDTPDKLLMMKPDRHLSSGCVRLEDAARFARWLYGKPLVAPSKAAEQKVNLPEPVPVYITYLTAMPEAGSVAYRTDTYRRDQARLASLWGQQSRGTR